MNLAMVAIGGALGASLRYLAVSWASRTFGTGFPSGTLIVNVIGSLLIGLLAVALLERAPEHWGRYAPLAITGLLGGFTTFSAFSLDALGLLEEERYTAAAAYVGGSVMLSLLAALAGVTLARALAA